MSARSSVNAARSLSTNVTRSATSSCAAILFAAAITSARRSTPTTFTSAKPFTSVR